MKEVLNKETVKAVLQVVNELSIDDCKALEKELTIGKDGLKKGQVGEAYHSTGWKYSFEEFVDSYHHFDKMGKGVYSRRWALAQLVVWSRCGNCPRAMRRFPKSWEELGEMEDEWLKDKGLDEMGFVREPDRVLKSRYRRMGE